MNRNRHGINEALLNDSDAILVEWEDAMECVVDWFDFVIYSLICMRNHTIRHDRPNHCISLQSVSVYP